MKYVVKGIGVDAGLIIVADLDYLKAQPGFDAEDRRGVDISVSPDSYMVSWRIQNTWNGNIKGQDKLRVTSGTVRIVDPCYCIGGWDKWLDDTDCGKGIESDQAFVIDKMGGDGTFEVQLSFT